MKVTPMLFKDEMVRAIVDGRKTQTRREMNVQPCRKPNLLMLGNSLTAMWMNKHEDGNEVLKCPYGKPGDLIYIKETHAFSRLFDLMPPRDVPVGSDVYYKAAMSEQEFHNLCAVTRPSIFMPRWASRLTLKIKSIRLERLQDISEEDAKSEGAEPKLCTGYPYPNPPSTHINGFCQLWQSINGPGSWEANPWLWVIEYEPIMQNVDVYLSELEEVA